MGVSHSNQRRAERTVNPQRAPTYLDTVKLVLLSAGWAIVQWVRHELEQSHIRALQGAPQEERRRRSPHTHGAAENRSDKKNLFDQIPPELRRMTLDWIDQSVTPVLIDQWRVKLVEVLLGNTPPAPEEEDPYLRAALLQSLKDLEAPQEDRRSRGSTSGARAQAAQPPPTIPRQDGYVHVVAEDRPGPSSASASSSRREASAASRPSRMPSHIPSREPIHPTAPPFPAHEEVQPSAPPLVEDMAGPSTSSHYPGRPGETEDLECPICMEATVDVQISRCHHQMCHECAKAVICMENRGPTCPFCRGPIDTFEAVHVRAAA